MCAFGLETHLDVSLSDCTTGSSQLVWQMWTDAERVWRQQGAKNIYILEKDILDFWFGGFCSVKLHFLDFTSTLETKIWKNGSRTSHSTEATEVQNWNIFLISCAFKIRICTNILCPNIVQARVILAAHIVVRIICANKINICIHMFTNNYHFLHLPAWFCLLILTITSRKFLKLRQMISKRWHNSSNINVVPKTEY